MTTTTTMTTEDFGGEPQRKARYTTTYRAAGPALPTPLIFRIRVYMDPYKDQSYATAEVLADDRTWTNVATLHPDSWHAGMKTKRDYEQVTGRLKVAVSNIFNLGR